MRGYLRRVVWGICLGIMLAGCAAATPEPTATVAITPTTILEGAPTPADASSDVEATPEITTLVVWWPDVLAPPEDDVTTALLSRDIEAFSDSQDSVEIDFRRRRTQDVGGIVSTLRTANLVAPGALPDLTLVRRDDLPALITDGLVQPLEGLVPSATITDMFASAFQLGRVDGELYGLSYILDITLMAYNGDVLDAPDAWTFDRILEQQVSFAIPGSRPSSVSNVVLLQYLDAAGIAPSSGTFTFQPDDLRDVLTFYAQAAEDDLLSPDVTTYSTSTSYETALISGDLDAGLVTTTTLQRLRREGYTPQIGVIPTRDGDPTTVLSGWVWVVVTDNPQRQAVALSFVDWMMAAERQGEYAATIGGIPSQRSALRLFPYDGLDATILDTLLMRAYPVPTDLADVVFIRALQTAFIDVVTGNRTPDEATQDVIDTVGG